MGLAKVVITAGFVFLVTPGVAVASVTVNSPAAFTGTYGMEVDLAPPAAQAYVQDDTPAAERRYRARMYVNADLVGPDPFEVPIFSAYSVGPSSSVRVAGVALESAGGGGPIGLRFTAREDDGTPRSVGPYPLALGWSSIEIDWSAATSAGSNDGFMDVWTNGVLMPGLSDLENDEAKVDLVRLGKTGPSTATGMVDFDDFESRRDVYIGLVPNPAPPFLIFRTGFESGDVSAWSLAVGFVQAVPTLGFAGMVLTSLLLLAVSLRLSPGRGH